MTGAECPTPRRDHSRVTMAHGGGGLLTAELVEGLFRPGFGPAAADAPPTDAAVVAIPPGAGRLAITTDTFVVRPLFFPGGCIGDLAVNGTVNDLATAGAQPLAMATAFVLEEGLDLDELAAVVEAMGIAAAEAGVPLLTGDTKVVERVTGDGLFVTTTGVGIVPDGVDLGPSRVRPGDAVVLSGALGRHGMAVMSVREGLEFGTELRSDTAPLHRLTNGVLAAGVGVRALRDLTRGGLSEALCELAETAGVGIDIDDAALVIPDEVRAACAFLGLDPAEVANEGCLVAVVDAADAGDAVAAMRTDPRGRDATVIGAVTDGPSGRVTARTTLGARRVVLQPLGEQLPRIC